MSEAREHWPLGEYAGFASRLSAFLIDTAIIAVVSTFAVWAAVELLDAIGVKLGDCESMAARSPYLADFCHFLLFAAPIANVVFVLVYALFFWSTTGQTPGKAAMGVRVVRLNGRPMNLTTAMRRLAAYVLSLWTLGLGFLVILSDDRRQSLHDRLAGTCVVYSWSRPTGHWR
jgi:uncharacterized RDD family membrane protein YckC